MKIVHIKKPPKRMSLFFVGDTHYPRGKREKFKEVLDKHILGCKYDPRMIFMGDAIEGITSGDPRYDPEETGYHINHGNGISINMISEQWKMFEDDMQGVVDDCVVDLMVAGNHESSLIKYQSRNDMKIFCDRNNINYGGNGYSIIFYDYKVPLIILASHGQGGGVTTKYVVGKLEDDAKLLQKADIVVRGHHHKLVTLSHIPGFSVDGKKNDIYARHQKLGCTGSFLTNYELGVYDYGEKKGYPPLPIGYIRAEIEDGKILSFNEVVV